MVEYEDNRNKARRVYTVLVARIENFLQSRS